LTKIIIKSYKQVFSKKRLPLTEIKKDDQVAGKVRCSAEGLDVKPGQAAVI
jgi:hypothetical protein